MFYLSSMNAVGCMVRSAVVDHTAICAVALSYNFPTMIKTDTKKFSSSSSTTINTEEVKKFQGYSSEWWNSNSYFRPLHSMNSLRVPLIRDGLRTQRTVISPKPLAGFSILDVGCGGGILSEPLARLGAKVTGIDPAAELIEIAQQHSSQNVSIRNNLTYICTTVEELVGTSDERYNGVVASEVFEHVDNVDLFLSSCIDLLKEGGSIFLTTINKTRLSYWLAILAAERLFKLLPVGTHEWDRFISPIDLQYLLEMYGCHVKLIHGTFYNPFTNQWSWTKNASVTYAIHAVKLARSQPL